MNVIFLFLVIITILFIVRANTKEKYRILHLGTFSEPNMACATGQVSLCRLSSGKGGLCNKRAGKCIDPDPRSIEDFGIPGFDTYHEFSWQCTQPTMNACQLKNGNPGICGLSGTCLPSTLNVY